MKISHMFADVMHSFIHPADIRSILRTALDACKYSKGKYRKKERK
jgi:hypothetical protein